MATNMICTSPEASRPSLGRVMETSNLSFEARQARREASMVLPIIPPPPVPEPFTENLSDRGSRQTELDPHVIFEGMGDVCTTC